MNERDDRERRRPRLTSLGATIVGASLAAGIFGWGLGYTAFAIAAVAGAIVLAAGFLAAGRLPDLDVAREIEPVRVERGRPAAAHVIAVNRRQRATARCSVSQRVEGIEQTRSIPALRNGRSVVVSFELPTSHRGALTIDALRLERSDPFGLWRSGRHVASTGPLLVQPRIHDIDPRPGGRLRHVDGPTTDAANDGTITFHSLREYSPGDDLRRVHWRSSARAGTLMVRDHVDTSLPSTIVVLDTDADAYRRSEDFESAVDVASSVIAASRRHGYLARLITSAGEVMTMRAGARGQDLSDHLAGVQPDDGSELRIAAQGVVRGRERDAITIVTGEVDADAIAQIGRMASGFVHRSLVTIRPVTDRSITWTGGLHLSGHDARSALVRWHAGADTDRIGRAPRRGTP